jgi:hypothetical protein
MNPTIEEIQRLLEANKACVERADRVSDHIARGIGGREVALAKTNLQQASFWLVEAQKLIGRTE